MRDWQTLLAIDFDKWAAATYRANFPGIRVECGPVSDYLDTLPAADVILGGPPCQPFSLAGEGKGENDERDCIPDYIEAVRRVRPRMFLMENVRGLLTAKHLGYFYAAVEQLKACGYAVQWRLLDAVNFGVPQFRERVWVWGIRSDLYAAGMRHAWPVPTHAWPPPQGADLWGASLLPGVTVGEALGISGLLKLQSHADPAATIDRPAPTLRSGGAGHDGCCLRLQYDHGVASADAPSPTMKAGGNTDASGKQGGGCPPVIEYRWSDAPAHTIGAGSREPVQNWKAKGYVRRLMPLECLRLQSGPDGFAWPEKVTKTAMYRVVGNGWACTMGRAFADAFAAVDPESRTVLDLFCGGGLGATGWHGKHWSYEPLAETAA